MNIIFKSIVWKSIRYGKFENIEHIGKLGTFPMFKQLQIFRTFLKILKENVKDIENENCGNAWSNEIFDTPEKLKDIEK